MEQPAIAILNANRIMAISTVRPDGWPQTTVVGYANRGFDIVFLIFRASQKYANIQRDNRVSIAVAPEPEDLEQLKAVYAGMIATEITDPQERDDAWRLLVERHSNLAGFKIPGANQAVFMRGKCRHVSVLDFSQGLGHREQLTVDDKGVVTNEDLSKGDWPVTAADTFDREGMGVAAKE
jgi:nitroimidazol reductase NimA-like FMN-containing flavoprotein (pyridoxamine 5'-phosphate oxidase superfamily)